MSDLILFNRDKNRYPGGGLYILTLIYEATPPLLPTESFLLYIKKLYKFIKYKLKN